jgi:hypothetical protein
MHDILPPDLREDRMLSVKEVAALDNTSHDTVRREIKAGKLPEKPPAPLPNTKSR